MKLKDLIKKLQQYDGEFEVDTIASDDNDNFPCEMFINVYDNFGIVEIDMHLPEPYVIDIDGNNR